MGFSTQSLSQLKHRLFTFALALGMGSLSPLAIWSSPAQAQTNQYCRLNEQAVAEKDQLRDKAFDGDAAAKKEYDALLSTHGNQLNRCRSQNWPQHQAIWLRVYPCDTRAGVIDKVLDDIVDKGYDKLYLEVFYDSQALLPANDNKTAWRSVLRDKGMEDRDFMAEVIKKGHARGLKVYAWMFGLNFGYSYANRGDRQNVMARNGFGQSSLDFVKDGAQAFADPYHPTAQEDYYELVQQILKRKPDGILFDYIRYPRGTGTQSVVASVNDLWIYSPASVQALYSRAQNQQGLVLIEKYLRNRKITVSDVAAVMSQYPNEDVPRWQGRNASSNEKNLSATQLHQRLENDLWSLTVGHAAQGVVDFVRLIGQPAEKQGIPAGAVFFPGANQVVGQRGFDSRLQPWDRFPASMEWHSMAYGVCGSPKCIVNEIARVFRFAPSGTEIIPAIAGNWDKNIGNRPSLKDQMAAIKTNFPQIKSVSHFAYSWQEPESDNNRKFCRV
ncbi:MAG: family 10 glycosylhydrolase [Limnothrix sp.]